MPFPITVGYQPSSRPVRRIGIALTILTVVIALSLERSFAEPPAGADSKLPVRDQLWLWLDAAVAGAAASATTDSSSEDDIPLSRWVDASGNDRDFSQPDVANQPTLVNQGTVNQGTVNQGTVNRGTGWMVRFDGQNDALRCLSEQSKADAMTIVLVTAIHHNSGGFRGLMSANAPGRNDYQSGWNIDLGSPASTSLNRLNVEGAGFGGEQNLLADAIPFGELQTIQVNIDPSTQSVSLSVDGKQAGERSFRGSELSLQELTLGARYVGIGGSPPRVHGPIQADIAEVLIYDRVLTSRESEELHAYLRQKHRELAETLKQRSQQKTPAITLEKVGDPPPIQMLQDGFSVRELPLSLTNVNNVRFRDDGRLVTLGYNGDIHLLRDSDGDGLEDQADLFWKNEGSLRGPIGLLLTPPNDARGQGAFVASKGKVSLIVDTDGDDRADKEIVVASGWREIPQNVDAVGLAMDDDGWLYFGLGTANYANAYLIDDSGKAQYDIDDERGTVQRVSPDFSRRETVCTGIRFPIAFAFNRHGDLFCTEQEGATWLANGNPFDELLHIRPSRHYGFPPRHPRHNPHVIDEPSTFNYSPQHQSTCGMVFNEGVGGGPVFGPGGWSGDAIVCGESRGKLWRTKLVKTATGYVAASQLIACLQHLTVDVCVAPDGDLVVACHSGPPDWGTGPAGIGKLFRIETVKEDAPRPVTAWAESPNEIRIAFDHPLDPSGLSNLRQRIEIQHGKYVRAGDRYENLVPPYAVVQQQRVAPRYRLAVATASVTPDLRTLVIGTDAMPAGSHYAVSLRPEPDATDVSSNPAAESADSTPQSLTEVDFPLNGLEVSWTPAATDDATVVESPDVASLPSWIPHVDLQVSRALTNGSALHDALWSATRQPGTLTLRTAIDLHHFLRPAVQPGSSLDYQWPREDSTVTFRSSHPFSIELADDEGSASVITNDDGSVSLACHDDRNDPIEVSIEIVCHGTSEPSLTASVTTNEDSRPRPLPLHRFLLPWAKSSDPDHPAESSPRRITQIEGGNWGRGRRVFHSEAAACFKCHAVRGIGASIGPDLANLVHRDYESVARDIVHPSYSINPDYFGHRVLLEDGRVLAGILTRSNQRLTLTNSEGTSIALNPTSIESMEPATVSIMPEGLEKKLKRDQWRDLMTFLLTEPPHMPLDSPLEAPPVRTGAELAAVLRDSAEPPESWQPLRIVLVAGKKDHGPGEHDYPAWQNRWGQLLAAASEVDVEAAWDFPTDSQMATADVLVFFQKGAWNEQRQRQLDDYLRRGGGAVYLHWAVNGDERAADFSRRIGLASRGGSIKYRHGPLTLNIHNTDHPIVRNIDRLELYDESYWELTGNVGEVTLLASSVEEGQSRPQIWTYKRDRGRVFVSIPGHYSWTFDDPLFRVLLLRGIAWTADQPVDRFNELAPLGARLAR